MDFSALLSSAFCAHFPKMIVEHLQECAQCRQGVTTLVNSLPIVKAFIPGDIAGMLDNMKGNSNGKNRPDGSQ